MALVARLESGYIAARSCPAPRPNSGTTPTTSTTHHSLAAVCLGLANKRRRTSGLFGFPTMRALIPMVASVIVAHGRSAIENQAENTDVALSEHTQARARNPCRCEGATNYIQNAVYFRSQSGHIVRRQHWRRIHQHVV